MLGTTKWRVRQMLLTAVLAKVFYKKIFLDRMIYWLTRKNHFNTPTPTSKSAMDSESMLIS